MLGPTQYSLVPLDLGTFGVAYISYIIYSIFRIFSYMVFPLFRMVWSEYCFFAFVSQWLANRKPFTGEFVRSLLCCRSSGFSSSILVDAMHLLFSLIFKTNTVFNYVEHAILSYRYLEFPLVCNSGGRFYNTLYWCYFVWQ